MLARLDIATSFLASAARLGTGLYVGALGPRPLKLLQLFEFEGCPFCRKVREALAILDLDAQVYPCPKGGQRYRPLVHARGGMSQFPYLVDPNTGQSMYESSLIVRYLFTNYGNGSVPLMLKLRPLADLTSTLASYMRLFRGTYYHNARRPKKLLELYGIEPCPDSRCAREELSRLEIAYVLRNVSRNSPRREQVKTRIGTNNLPYLVDPNTGTHVGAVGDIVRYLRETYALG
ncbi:MAG: glutathione S-transferase N-terminal domain-containing protein [Gammaproteobacteria bacterium]|nr:glutathione S-transferase N-terminal domain-containing protein [Gammaproteobacteria bacterium]